MHPFFSRTRASIISWPNTNCRCNKGFRSSSGIVCQGTYCRADLTTVFLEAGLPTLCSFSLKLAFPVLVFFFAFAMFFSTQVSVENPSGNSFQNAYVALGLTQDFNRFLVFRILVCSHRILHTVEFNDHRTLLQASLVDLHSRSTRKKSPTVCLHDRSRQLGVFRQNRRVLNRMIEGNPISLGHSEFLNLELVFLKPEAGRLLYLTLPPYNFTAVSCRYA